jgi:regulatory protein
VRSRARRSGKPAPVPGDSANPDAAYAEAVKRLARQPQSRAALAQKLVRGGFGEEAVEAALDRAQAAGYLNDREYAESLVRRRAGSRGHALIAQELRAKGVADWAADPALAQVDPEAEVEQAVAIGRGLLARKAPADADALFTYLAPRLARRGYSSGLVYRVCQRLSVEFEGARLFDEISEHN